VPLALGSYCWPEAAGTACHDIFVLKTRSVPLHAARWGQIDLANPEGGWTITVAQVIRAYSLTGVQPEPSPDGDLVWNGPKGQPKSLGQPISLANETTDTGLRFNANLMTGRYAVLIGLDFKYEGVKYGAGYVLLLDVD
jgi:hypothetical protein